MRTNVWLGAVAGALLGAAVGAGVYLLLEPVLEDASGWLRETQGLVWNLVPLLSVVGALAGALLADRAKRRRS